MATRSIVGTMHGAHIVGRYVHWDGYPDGVGRELARIVHRDGAERAVQVLTNDWYGWSAIDADTDANADVRNIGQAVAGYGVAYDDQAPQDWCSTNPADGSSAGADYAYAITATEIRVLVRSQDRRSFVVGDPIPVPPSGCGFDCPWCTAEPGTIAANDIDAYDDCTCNPATCESAEAIDAEVRAIDAEADA